MLKKGGLCCRRRQGGCGCVYTLPGTKPLALPACAYLRLPAPPAPTVHAHRFPQRALPAVRGHHQFAFTIPTRAERETVERRAGGVEVELRSPAPVRTRDHAEIARVRQRIPQRAVAQARRCQSATPRAQARRGTTTTGAAGGVGGRRPRGHAPATGVFVCVCKGIDAFFDSKKTVD